MDVSPVRITYTSAAEGGAEANVRWLERHLTDGDAEFLPLYTGGAQRPKALAMRLCPHGVELPIWIYPLAPDAVHEAVRTAILDQSDAVVFVARPDGDRTADTQRDYDRLVADLQRGAADRSVPVAIQLPAPKALPEVAGPAFRRLPQHTIYPVGARYVDGVLQTFAGVVEAVLREREYADVDGLRREVESMFL